MKTDTNKSGSNVGHWVKKSLCAGIVMGMAMSASTAFAGMKFKEDHGNQMTPFARIAHVKVVKDEYGNIDREETYKETGKVAAAIANYVAKYDDSDESGFPANWIVGGTEGGVLPADAIMQIPSPFPVDPENLSLGIKKAKVLDLCNAYYAKQALGVAPIAGTTKKVVNGYSHAPALPCELAVWNDDENIYIDMLDPNAIFSLFFTDVLVSADMQDPDFAAAITALPVAVKSEIKTMVYKALGEAGYKYNTHDKMIGPKYKTVEELFEVVAASPHQSPFKHVAYTKTSGESFAPAESAAVAQAIINTMSIHGGTTPDGRAPGVHDPELEAILSEPGKNKWRSARHEPLGLPGKPAKNWVIEACSPYYAKMAMGTGMHHATALPCEISVQVIDTDGIADSDGNFSYEELVISYLDPHFMLGALFADMTDDEKAALGDVPGYILDDLQDIVQFALDSEVGGLEVGVSFSYNMLP
ncbi:MAG: hypothetical protein DRQ44_04665 [Gammaproteobacteria bacterium]|nr:MAG: hypothetical protein DRQ44_04665 [Gammaproteobacteria bacterium]